MSLPFSYKINRDFAHIKLAVIFHVFYPEMLDEFNRYFLNIPFNFDLYITTDTQEKRLLIERHFLNWHKGIVEVRIAPNRGRDIAPKLITCRDVYDRYGYVLHIHTKKTPQSQELGGLWRNHLLESLLGSEAIVRSVFEAFELNPNLGILAPQHFYRSRKYINWAGNFNLAEKIGRRLGINIKESNAIDFPSGSMFWAKTNALKPLLDIDFSFDEFAEEAGQQDGTLAHAIERMYFFSCEKAGFCWAKIVSSSLIYRDYYKAMTISSPDGYHHYMVSHNEYLKKHVLPSNITKTSVFMQIDS